jgi:taurine dioxygenase
VPVNTRPLSPTLGVEIQGFDPRNPSSEDLAAFERAFDQNHLVLVRGVDLNEDQNFALATHLGNVSRAGRNMPGDAKFGYISNVAKNGRLPDGELLFHADQMFLDHPLKAISLYGMQVPAVGGETCFMDAAAAYESLPEAAKKKIESLKARHVYDYDANTANKAPVRGVVDDRLTTAIHPVVETHPATGKKILFVCRLFTVEILDIPREEGDAILDELFAHLEAQKTNYEHKWKVNDFVIWDNRILQHARNDFPATEKRHMRRVPIAAEGAPV